MNTVPHIDQAAVDAWCAEIRALHTVYARPITSPDDPRVDALMQLGDPIDYRAFAAIAEYAKDLGEKYFVACFDGKPDVPLQAPSWALAPRAMYGDYPEVSVEFESRTFGDQLSVCWQKSVTIVVEDMLDSGGAELVVAGRVHDDARHPDIVVEIEGQWFDLTASPEDVRALALALYDAADALDRASE